MNSNNTNNNNISQSHNSYDKTKEKVEKEQSDSDSDMSDMEDLEDEQPIKYDHGIKPLDINDKSIYSEKLKLKEIEKSKNYKDLMKIMKSQEKKRKIKNKAQNFKNKYLFPYIYTNYDMYDKIIRRTVQDPELVDRRTWINCIKESGFANNCDIFKKLRDIDGAVESQLLLNFSAFVYTSFSKDENHRNDLTKPRGASLNFLMKVKNVWCRKDVKFKDYFELISFIDQFQIRDVRINYLNFGNSNKKERIMHLLKSKKVIRKYVPNDELNGSFNSMISELFSNFKNNERRTWEWCREQKYEKEMENYNKLAKAMQFDKYGKNPVYLQKLKASKPQYYDMLINKKPVLDTSPIPSLMNDLGDKYCPSCDIISHYFNCKSDNVCNFCDNMIFDEVVSILYYTAKTKATLIEDWFVAGMLDLLKTVRVGDFFDDLLEKDKKTIIKHDMLLLNKFLRLLTKQVINLPVELSDEDANLLQNSYYFNSYRFDSTILSPNPKLYAEFNCAILYLSSLLNEEFNLFYSPVDVRLNGSKINFVKPTNILTNVNVIDQEPKSGSPNVYFSLLCEKSDLVLNNNSFYIIRVLNEALSVSHNKCVYKLVNHIMPYDVNLESDLNKPVFRLNDKVYLRKQLLVRDNVAIYCYESQNVNYLVPIKSVLGDSFRTLLWLPDPNSISFLNGFNIKPCNVDIKMKMLKALCIYNLSGDKTIKDLTKYAVGYLYRKFIIGSRVIKEESGDNLLIRSHVLLAYLSMLQIHGKHMINNLMTEVLTVLGPLLPEIKQILDNGMAVALGLLVNWFPKIKEFKDLKTLLSAVKNWSFKLKTTSGLHHITDQLTLQIAHETSEITVNNSDQPVCTHHFNCSMNHKTKNFVCVCCNLYLCDEDGKTCECCEESSHTFDFDGESSFDLESKPIIKEKPLKKSEAVKRKDRSENTYAGKVKQQTVSEHIKGQDDNVSSIVDLNNMMFKDNSKITKNNEKLKAAITLFGETAITFINHHKNFMVKQTSVPETWVPCVPENKLCYLPTSLFKIIEWSKDYKQYNPDDCGLAVAVHLMAEDYELVYNTSVKKKHLAALDIIKLFNRKKINVIILTPLNVLIKNNSGSDVYQTIIHSDLIDDKNKVDNHFYFGKAEMREMHNLSYHEPKTKLCATNSGLISLIEVYEQYQQRNILNKDKIILTIKKIDKELVLTNNNSKTHDLIAGDISISVEPSVSLSLENLTNYHNKISRPFIILESGLPNNYTKYVLELLKAMSYDYAYVHDKLDVEDVKQTLTMACRNYNGKLCLNKSELNLKSLDKLHVKYENKWLITDIRIVDNKVLTTIPFSKELSCTVQTFKMSHGSLLRRICSLIENYNKQWGKAEKILKESLLVTGGPGCGKTTETMKNLGKSRTLWVAQTRSIVNATKKKVKRSDNIVVKTIESALLDKSQFDTLVIDECYQIDWVTAYLLILTHDIRTVVLLGDKNQIKYKNMMKTSGLLPVDNLVDVLKPTKIKVLKETFRFDQMICNVLADLDVELKPHAKANKVQLQVLNINLNRNKKEMMKDLILSNKIQVLITFDHITMMALEKEFKHIKGLQIVKAHGYQGCESDRVMVYQSSLNKYGTLHTSREYIVSALTRAKSLLIWVINIPGFDKNDISKTVTNASCGYKKDDEVLLIEEVKTDNKKLMTLQSWLEKSKIKYDVKDLFKQKDLLLRFKGDKVVFEIKNLPVIEVRGDEVTVLNEEYNHFKKLLLTNSINIKCHSTLWFKLVTLLETNVDNKITFDLLGKWPITIHKTSGCSIGANTIIMLNGQIIAQSFTDHFHTTLCIADRLNVSIKNELETALKGEPTDKIFLAISTLKFNYFNVLFERQAHKCFYNDEKEKSLMIQVRENFKGLLDKTQLKRWNLSSEQKFGYIISGRPGNFSLEIFSPFEMVSYQEINFKEDTIETLLYYLIHRAVIPKVEVKGVEGLLIDLETHMERETEVGKSYKRKLGEMKLSQTSSTKDIVWLSASIPDRFKDDTKSQIPNMSINTTGISPTLHPVVELMENLTIVRDYRMQTEEKIFGGLNVVALVIAGIEELNLYNTTKNTSFVTELNHNLTTATKLINERTKALKKEMKIKVLLNTKEMGGKTLLSNFNLNHYSFEQMYDLLSAGVKIRLLLPTNMTTEGTKYYNVVRHDKYSRLLFRNADWAVNISHWLLKPIMNGQTYKIKGKKEIQFKTIYEINEFKYTELSIGDVDKAKSQKVYIHEPLLFNRIIKVSSWVIQSDIIELLQTGELLYVKSFIISSKIYDTFMMRLMTGDDDIKSLLFFARTLASTFRTTDVGPNYIKETPLELYVSTAYVAFAHHHQLNKTAMLLEQILDTVRAGGSLIDSNLEFIIKSLFSLLGMTDTMITEAISQVLKKLFNININSGVRVPNKISTITEKWVWLGEPTDEPEQKYNEDLTSSNDDGDDDEKLVDLTEFEKTTMRDDQDHSSGKMSDGNDSNTNNENDDGEGEDYKKLDLEELSQEQERVESNESDEMLDNQPNLLKENKTELLVETEEIKNSDVEEQQTTLPQSYERLTEPNLKVEFGNDDQLKSDDVIKGDKDNSKMVEKVTNEIKKKVEFNVIQKPEEKRTNNLLTILSTIPQWLKGTPLLVMNFPKHTYSKYSLLSMVSKLLTTKCLSPLLKQIEIDTMSHLIPYHHKNGETEQLMFEKGSINCTMIDNKETIVLITVKKEKAESILLFSLNLTLKYNNTLIALTFDDLKSKKTLMIRKVLIPNLLSNRVLISNDEYESDETQFPFMGLGDLVEKVAEYHNDFKVLNNNLKNSDLEMVLPFTVFKIMLDNIDENRVILSYQITLNKNSRYGYVLVTVDDLVKNINSRSYSKELLTFDITVDLPQEKILEVHDSLFGHVYINNKTVDFVTTIDGRKVIGYTDIKGSSADWRTPIEHTDELLVDIEKNKIIDVTKKDYFLIKCSDVVLEGQDDIDRLIINRLTDKTIVNKDRKETVKITFDIEKVNFTISNVLKSALLKSKISPEVFTDTDNFVQKLVKNWSKLLSDESTTEKERKFIMKCLKATNMDVKLDNNDLRLKSPNSDYIVVDFNQSVKLTSGHNLSKNLYVTNDLLDHKVIYDPKNFNDKCVWLCLEFIKTKVPELVIPVRLQRMTMTFHNLLVVANSLNIGFVIIMKEQTIISSKDKVRYGIKVIGVKQKRHAVVVELHDEQKTRNYKKIILSQNFTQKLKLEPVIDIDSTISFNTTITNNLTNPYYIRQGLLLPVVRTVTGQNILIGANLLSGEETILLVGDSTVSQLLFPRKTNLTVIELLNEDCKSLLTLNKKTKKNVIFDSIMPKTFAFDKDNETSIVKYRTLKKPSIITNDKDTYVLDNFDNRDHHWLFIKDWDTKGPNNNLILNNNICSKEVLSMFNKTKNQNVRLLTRKGLLYICVENKDIKQTTLIMSCVNKMELNNKNVTLDSFNNLLFRTNERTMVEDFAKIKKEFKKVGYDEQKGLLTDLSRTASQQEISALNSLLGLKSMSYQLNQTTDPLPLNDPHEQFMLLLKENNVKVYDKVAYRVFMVTVTGGSNHFVYQLSKFKGYKNSQDKWNLTKIKESNEKEKLISKSDEKKLLSIEALNNENFLLQQREGNWFNVGQIRKIMGDNGHFDERNLELNNKVVLYLKDDEKDQPLMDITTPELYDLWENLDQSSVVELHNNLATGQVIMKQVPANLITITKHTINEFPAMARPYIQKLLYTDINVTTKRLFGAQKLRKYKPKNYLEQAVNFANTYFKKGWLEICNQWMNQPLVFNYKLTREWLLKANYTDKIKTELLNWLERDLSTFNYTEVHVTTKMEAIFKEDNWNNIADQNPRIIVWPHYKISAIVSPLFKIIKSRFKTLLHDKFYYTDGLTPIELDALIRTAGESKYVYEGDLSKQDRQTDEGLLGVEMFLYILLGLEVNIAEWWSATHGLWKFKTKFFSGYRKAMRQTGTPTTALGNVFTNFQVHKPLVQKMWDNIVLFLGLGDDNAMFIKNKFDIKSHIKHTKLYYNMLLKCKQDDKAGKYCSFTLYKDFDGTWSLGPDFIKLKYKYELTNGVSDLNDVTIKTRKMSYLTTVGKTKNTSEIVQKEQLPIKLETWYNFDLCNQSTARNWNTTTNDVERHYNDLIKYLGTNEYREKKFLVFTHQKY